MRRITHALATIALVAASMGLSGAQAPEPEETLKEARKLSVAGRQDEALALYERVLKSDAKSFDALLGAGVVLDLKGDYARARGYLQKAIDLAPPSVLAQALSAMAVSYAFEARAGDAAKYYQRQLELQTNAGALDQAAATCNALGRVYLESGDLANAERWYGRGYELARSLKSIPQDQVDLWELRYRHAQARIAVRRDDTAEAERLTGEVKRIVDQGGPNETQRPVYEYLAGYVALYAKRYDAAIDALSRADQRDPFILGLQAQAYEGKGDSARAREFYEKVLASSSHSLQAAFSRPLARARLK